MKNIKSRRELNDSGVNWKIVYIKAIISKTNLKNKNIFLMLFFQSIFVLSLFSCATTNVITTGTKGQLTSENKNKIKRIGIVIKQEKDFNFTSEILNMSNASQWAPGLLGKVVRDAERQNRGEYDKEQAEALKPLHKQYDLSTNFQAKLSEYAMQAELFNDIVNINEDDIKNPKIKNIDAVLQVIVREWGLRRCTDPEKHLKGYLELELDINAKIFSIDSFDNEIWSMDELYVSGKKYLIDEIYNNPIILKNLLDYGINELSKEIINKILYY